MTFVYPVMLLGLLPVLAIAIGYVLAQGRRRRFPLTYSSVNLVRVAAASKTSFLRRHAPAALFLLAMAVLVVGLARPQASFANPEQGGVVILAIDASGSMNNPDVKPSRIDAARAAVRKFVQKQPKGVRIGVVTFASFASVIVPPTEDRNQVIGAVDFVTLARGTNIGEGLQAALMAILEDERGEAVSVMISGTPVPGQRALHPTNATIVLLSDGASTTGPSPLLVADQVADAGIRVYTVGLGVRRGGSFPGGGVIGFGGGFMELDEPTLRGIAERTGGKYFTAESASQLDEVYRDLALRTAIVVEKDELTFLASAIGALLLVTGGVLSAMWSTRLP